MSMDDMNNNRKDSDYAIILEKQMIDVGVYFLKYDRIVEGEYHKFDNYFCDKYGKEFPVLDSIDDLYDVDKYVAYNVKSKGELANSLHVDEIDEDALSYYNDELNNYFYIALRNDLGHVGMFKFNVETFRTAIDMMCENGKYKLLPVLSEAVEDENSPLNEIVTFERLSDDMFLVRDDPYEYGDDEDKDSGVVYRLEIDGEKERTCKREEIVAAFGGNVEDVKRTSKHDKKDSIDLKDILKKIRSTLIAQDEPSAKVVTEIIRKIKSPALRNRGILITGSTGVGKTKLMSLVAKYLDRPFYKIDATKLTVPGYTGTDIEEELWNLYLKCDRNLDKAENAIIFIDEIDKKGSFSKTDVSGKGVLNVLLPFIEGGVYNACPNMAGGFSQTRIPISTDNMIVVFGGAFTDVYGDKFKPKEIGFGKDPVKVQEVTLNDFIEKAGMPDEFMGRIRIIKMNDLDVQAIKKILDESDESILNIQKRLFEEEGVILNVTDEYRNEVAYLAYELKTGARGLNNVVEESTSLAYQDVLENEDKYSEIILTGETARDPKNYGKRLVKTNNN